IELSPGTADVQRQCRARCAGTELACRAESLPLWRATDVRLGLGKLLDGVAAIGGNDDVATSDGVICALDNHNVFRHERDGEPRLCQLTLSCAPRRNVSIWCRGTETPECCCVIVDIAVIERVSKCDIELCVPVDRHDIPVRPEVLEHVP